MENYYTNERNHQILIALLKAHHIRKVIASPGSANSVFVGSIQRDPFFDIYSSVDERSAAYIACGLAIESGEAVVISCTGATAARNYMSGATEAFYSKLPILMVTSSQATRNNYHLFSQTTDRTAPPKDTCKISLTLPTVDTSEDEWECEVKANRALLELRRNGGGPVHINLITTYSYNSKTVLTQKVLPLTRIINRILCNDKFPTIDAKRIAIFIGSHKPCSRDLTKTIEAFCECNNAVVLCDHTSNYNGKYKIPLALVINQADKNKLNIPAYNVDLLIHIGEVSGEEGAMRMILSKETWRVSEDGEIRDTFKNMRYVFEMSEKDFFSHYCGSSLNIEYYNECFEEYTRYYNMQEEQLNQIPFSNVWVASQIAPRIPENSTVVLSILNTLRVWNYFKFPNSTNVYCPVGGFGIDGATSMLIGASFNNPDKLCFCITGDLAFFYDLNCLGNRSIGNNVRILLINNGAGFEFKKSYALAYRLLGDDVDEFVAAVGHFGHKSPHLVKHFAEDLGFDYLSANSKSEMNVMVDRFVSPKSKKPMIFEVFIDVDDEGIALDLIQNRK